MRILILGIALLALSTFAFAAPGLTATGLVSLTIDKFVSVDGAADKAITITNNGNEGAATLSFPCVANCNASVAFTKQSETGATRAVWTLTEASGTIVPDGGNATVKVNAKAPTGVQLLAGSDSCTVLATITAGALYTP